MHITARIWFFLKLSNFSRIWGIKLNPFQWYVFDYLEFTSSRLMHIWQSRTVQCLHVFKILQITRDADSLSRLFYIMKLLSILHSVKEPQRDRDVQKLSFPGLKNACLSNICVVSNGTHSERQKNIPTSWNLISFWSAVCSPLDIIKTYYFLLWSKPICIIML